MGCGTPLLNGDAALAAPALDPHPTQEIVDAFAVLAGLYWLIAGIAAVEPLVLAPRRPCPRLARHDARQGS